MRIALYLSLACISLVFGSCSMNKEGMNTISLQSGRLQTLGQLTNRHINREINSPANEKANQPGSFDVIANHVAIQVPVFHSTVLKKHFAGKNMMRKAGKKIAEIAKLPKTMPSINRMITTPTHKTSMQNLPFQGSNYLALWIVFLLASVLFYALAIYAFDSIMILSLVFNILGLLALLAFLLFIILWLIELYQAHQSQEETKP